MATQNNQSRGGYVDISSNSQVKKVYNKKGRLKRVLIVLLSIIFLICGSGLLYYYSVLESLNYSFITPAQTKNDTTGGDVGSESSNLTFDGQTLLSDSKILNVMLFGVDYSQEGENSRSDSMIMLSVDNRHKKLKLTTFMRDTWVNIPDYGYDKLTHAYSYGGAALTIQTIESNFGIKVDRYAVVDYESFRSIVDILGGVDIELTQDEIGYINFQMYINDKSGNTPRETITDSPGVVHLNGREALWYARDRGFDDENYPGVIFEGDDWDRTRRQRNFLSVVFSSMKDASLPQIISIVGEVGPLITTNFKKDEITTLVANSLKYLQYDVEQYCVPQGELGKLWKYSDPSINNSYIEISDMNTVRNDFAKFIFEDLIDIESSTQATKSTADE
ncbi:MAG: LCP family protein [Ruminococcus sp.]|nr:LCP family protein [Ruminococcus sp.]